MRLLEQIEGLASNFFGSLNAVLSIIKLEARLAGLSVYPLLLNVCMLFIILTTVWLSLMLLVGYLFTLLFVNIIIAIGLVTLLNIGLFILLLKYLQFNLGNMSFQKTRDYFSKKGKNEHDKLEKTSDC